MLVLVVRTGAVFSRGRHCSSTAGARRSSYSQSQPLRFIFLPLPTSTHFLLQGDPKVGTAPRGRGQWSKGGGRGTRTAGRGRGGSCTAGRGGVHTQQGQPDVGITAASLWPQRGDGHDRTRPAGRGGSEQGRPAVGDRARPAVGGTAMVEGGQPAGDRAWSAVGGRRH